MLESGGGVVEPLLDESAGGGGVVAELLSDGVLDIELELDEESAGAAGAVADESGVLPGEVDCCFEHADTKASAPTHNKRTLRFIVHLTDYRVERPATS